jgi:hypothetical protein
MDDMALLHPMALLNLEPAAPITPETTPSPIAAQNFMLFPNLPTEIKKEKKSTNT